MNCGELMMAEQEQILRVGAVDDHPVVLRGLAAELAHTAADIDLVAIAANVDELLAETTDLDVVLLDLTLHDGQDTQENIRRLLASDIQVLIYTGETKPIPIVRAVEAGALGLALKSDPVEEIAGAIRLVSTGREAYSGPLAANLISHGEVESLLSDRQVLILSLIAEGLPRKSIARQLGVAVSTVNEHVNRVSEVFRERGLGPTNSHSLVNHARAEGYLTD